MQDAETLDKLSFVWPLPMLESPPKNMIFVVMVCGLFDNDISSSDYALAKVSIISK
jgi:hypothetical protein